MSCITYYDDKVNNLATPLCHLRQILVVEQNQPTDEVKH